VNIEVSLDNDETVSYSLTSTVVFHEKHDTLTLCSHD